MSRQYSKPLRLNFCYEFDNNSFRVRRFSLEEKWLFFFRIFPKWHSVSWTPWRHWSSPERCIRWRRNLFLWMAHVIQPVPSPTMICRRGCRRSWWWSRSLISSVWLSVCPSTGGWFIARGWRSVKSPNPPSHPSSPDQLICSRFKRLIDILYCLILPDELQGTLDAVEGEEDAQGSRQEEV